jgi:hypothetical protein
MDVAKLTIGQGKNKTILRNLTGKEAGNKLKNLPFFKAGEFFNTGGLKPTFYEPVPQMITPRTTISRFSTLA